MLISVSGFLSLSRKSTHSLSKSRAVRHFSSPLWHFCFHNQKKQLKTIQYNTLLTLPWWCFSQLARYSRQQYHFMHSCNSKLNTLSSLPNQDASFPLLMRFSAELFSTMELVHRTCMILLQSFPMFFTYPRRHSKIQTNI